ncbi:MAG TPA: iron chelate uptake ABC transporter family permease subunit, partial [Beijerinckiaceae bacterium]|nr:iron chelate uptake ABC transporter family permease subunit [Beijerinckiaceae bacterium]
DRSFRHVEMAAPFLIVATAMILACGPGYAALTLGEDTARSLGIHVGRLRAFTVAAVAIGVGAGVAVAGAIGFVGLVAPHFVRSFVGGDPKRVLIPAGLAGAALLTAADIAVRLIPAETEIRIGVLTAALGVPVFLYLVLTQRAFFGGAAR